MFSHVKQKVSFLASNPQPQPSRTVWPRMSPTPRTTAHPSPPRVTTSLPPSPPTRYWGSPPPAPWASWTNPWMVSASGPRGMKTFY